MCYNNTPPLPASSDHVGRVVLCASQFIFGHTITPNISRKVQFSLWKIHIWSSQYLGNPSSCCFWKRCGSDNREDASNMFENREYEINTYRHKGFIGDNKLCDLLIFLFFNSISCYFRLLFLPEFLINDSWWISILLDDFRNFQFFHQICTCGPRIYHQNASKNTRKYGNILHKYYFCISGF